MGVRNLSRFALGLGLTLALLAVAGGGPGPAAVAPVRPPVCRASPGNGVRVARSGAFCPALPPPTGDVIDVYPAQASQLRSIVLNASSGDTILLHDGTYNLNGDYVWIRVPGLTMRSASGNREAVVIDGGYDTTEIITIAASDVTVADLTLKRASTHPIHVTPDFVDTADIENVLIYNVHIVDPGEQAIKINQNGGYYADNGVIACSHIELTDAGRPRVSGCYTGGVDAHQARGWVIRDNVIEGFWCEDGLSEHGIHFWTGSRDTLVERNVLIDNARGVGFGLLHSGDGRVYDDDPCPGADYVGHFGGIIRNNFVFASRSELFSSEYGFDCGICLAQACGTRVLHNTVASTQAPFSSIEWRWPNTDAEIINNLVSHNLQQRDGAVASLAGNLDRAPLSLFVDGTGGDLHLAEGAGGAIDQGISIAEGLCDEDIDGDPRPWGGGRDIGADEVCGIDLSSSRKTANPEEAGAGEVLAYSIELHNTGAFAATDTVLFDAIPAHTTYVPTSVHATSGAATDVGGIGWTGTVPSGGRVTITFQVTVNEGVFIENTAVVTDLHGTPTVLVAWVNARHVHLPLVLRQ
jgi:uncharacterized repeat protein (TIGR01451 family)